MSHNCRNRCPSSVAAEMLMIIRFTFDTLLFCVCLNICLVVPEMKHSHYAVLSLCTDPDQSLFGDKLLFLNFQTSLSTRVPVNQDVLNVSTSCIVLSPSSLDFPQQELKVLCVCTILSTCLCWDSVVKHPPGSSDWIVSWLVLYFFTSKYYWKHQN